VCEHLCYQRYRHWWLAQPPSLAVTCCLSLLACWCLLLVRLVFTAAFCSSRPVWLLLSSVAGGGSYPAAVRRSSIFLLGVCSERKQLPGRGEEIEHFSSGSVFRAKAAARTSTARTTLTHARVTTGEKKDSATEGVTVFEREHARHPPQEAAAHHHAPSQLLRGGPPWCFKVRVVRTCVFSAPSSPVTRARKRARCFNLQLHASCEAETTPEEPSRVPPSPA
jgi:hypothetical protein